MVSENSEVSSSEVMCASVDNDLLSNSETGKRDVLEYSNFVNEYSDVENVVLSTPLDEE